MSPRIIHLRRPVTLALQEGVFVPRGEPGILDDVDHRWEALRAMNPAYFDGRVLHVLGVHRNGHGGAVLHVIDCAYRFVAVQDESFDLGVHALGVKGITTRGDQVLVGLRSPTVAFYQNMWEFAPGGSVSPGDDPAALIQQELHEETGLTSAGEPIGIAVVFDPILRCWELVYKLQANEGALQPHAAEYSRLEWRPWNDLPENLSPIAQQMVEFAAPKSPQAR